MPAPPYTRVQQSIGDSVFPDQGQDLFLVILEVAERGEDLREGEVRKMRGDFLRGNTEAVELDNSAQRGSGADDDRLSTDNIKVTGDIAFLPGVVHC
jgi:hypothetical protein